MVHCSEFATETVHSGTDVAQDFADIVYDELWALNLDSVAVESYQVLLSKLDMTKPNFVQVFYGDNVNQVVATERPQDTNDDTDDYNFAAYSPSANITVGMFLVLLLYFV